MTKKQETGIKIQERREARGLTQERLAALIGVDVRTVNRWENGRYASMRLDHAMRLAYHLDTSLDLLFGQYDPGGAGHS